METLQILGISLLFNKDIKPIRRDEQTVITFLRQFKINNARFAVTIQHVSLKLRIYTQINESS